MAQRREPMYPMPASTENVDSVYPLIDKRSVAPQHTYARPLSYPPPASAAVYVPEREWQGAIPDTPAREHKRKCLQRLVTSPYFFLLAFIALLASHGMTIYMTIRVHHLDQDCAVILPLAHDLHTLVGEGFDGKKGKTAVQSYGEKIPFFKTIKEGARANLCDIEFKTCYAMTREAMLHGCHALIPDSEHTEGGGGGLLSRFGAGIARLAPGLVGKIASALRLGRSVEDQHVAEMHLDDVYDYGLFAGYLQYCTEKYGQAEKITMGAIINGTSSCVSAVGDLQRFFDCIIVNSGGMCVRNSTAITGPRDAFV